MLGLVETSVNWSIKRLYQRHYNNTRSIFNNFQLNYSRNSTVSKANYLPGGTAQVCMGNLTGRISCALHDDKKMGRWSGHKIQLQNDTFLFVVTAYRVCKTSKVAAKSSTISSHRQQYMILREEGEENPKPRRQFITDLNKQLKEWKVQSHDHIILMMDANEFHGEEQSGIKKLMLENNMVDAYKEKFPMDTEEFPTHINGSKRIDFILTTSHTMKYIKNIGYTSFYDIYDSDHQGIYIVMWTKVF
jgi:hypothetical protein